MCHFEGCFIIKDCAIFIFCRLCYFGSLSGLKGSSKLLYSQSKPPVCTIAIMFVTNLQGAGEEHFVIFDELLSNVSSLSLEGVRGANLSKSHVTDLSGTNYCLHYHFLIINHLYCDQNRQLSYRKLLPFCISLPWARFLLFLVSANPMT